MTLPVQTSGGHKKFPQRLIDTMERVKQKNAEKSA